MPKFLDIFVSGCIIAISSRRLRASKNIMFHPQPTKEGAVE